jgi:hypothetical protein
MKYITKPNHRRHSRDRNKPSRNNLVANQSVEQGRFSTLELADTSYIETSFGDPLSKLTRFLGERFSRKFLGEPAESQQAGGAIRRCGCLSRRSGRLD